MKYVVFLAVALGTVLLFLLSRASSNTAAFSQNYTLLLVLNLGVALALMGLVGYQLWVLWKKLKQRVFGTKLTLRLLWMFALMALLPGALVYGVSVQFLNKSIESWFDVRVDNALEGGLSLGQSALENLLQDLVKKGEVMALALADNPVSEHLTQLNRLREQVGVQEAALFSSRGKVLAISGGENASFLPDMPSASVLRQVRQQQPFSVIEPIAGKGLYLRVVVPVNVLTLSEDMRILQLLQPVPKRLASDAETVQAVYRDYQELSYSRLGLKRIYGMTLTLTLLLALLSAIALAFVLSQKLSAPLGLLAESTRAIAKGDFTQINPVQSRDELGALTLSFNRMTRQLADASAAVEKKQQQLEAAKVYLESILAHLSSGVLTFDEKLHLRGANPRAGEILGVDLSVMRGLPLLSWGSRDIILQPLAHAVTQHFDAAENKEWRQQIEFSGRASNQVLLVRGTRLPGVVDNGYVVVFDDITHLLQAQRDAAWGEVARRLAHEIKNPLTPIQLSAERLERKLADKLNQSDAEMLSRSTHTIVNQVAALKNMVDAFAEYARSPQLNLARLDLNQLVREVLTLYESSSVHIEIALAPDLPVVYGDAALLRQVMHNLMRNAEDALSDQPQAEIRVRTELVDAATVRWSIEDNGKGFPDALLGRLFEPYVTTKQKGTGLGLAIVKKIVDEHQGRILAQNIEPHGARVSIQLPRAEEVT
ncbi:MAG: ATP-binding protein [Sulfurimicrobium sp.]|jgi:nitrogen fixation/metabolism regulation signal transduction histidine kinase|nr:ATP-binding protein [Sulfurimicrobium sp.]MDP2200342.1 ATP-binding protein [Sulfurimicrobium sp.]MDP2963659.1 ATP-binding protein [Sulfurimicrobium sp.]MDP3686453.1 ATP-binding protein [Sulfurimicrobium sp.]MDZ7657423.1 ATP-binding protein [Sulfurimicrobium sp.]